MSQKELSLPAIWRQKWKQGLLILLILCECNILRHEDFQILRSTLSGFASFVSYCTYHRIISTDRSQAHRRAILPTDRQLHVMNILFRKLYVTGFRVVIIRFYTRLNLWYDDDWNSNISTNEYRSCTCSNPVGVAHVVIQLELHTLHFSSLDQL